MDVTTMVSTSLLIDKLTSDFPEFIFEDSHDFWWSNTKNTIFINSVAPDAKSYILHELAHALLGHRGYKRDIDLLKLERDAWEYAKLNLASTYEVDVDEEKIQHNLETYRDWLHARSQCPRCEATGLQIKRNSYQCLSCNQVWTVNEARVCALRRYTT